MEHPDGELVHVVGEIKDLIPLIPDRLGLGQALDLVHRFPAGVVDARLILLHPADVLGQGDVLFLRGGNKKQQILEQLLVLTVVVINAEFELEAEIFEESLVFLPVVFQHGEQLALDLLFQTGGDDLELPVVLQHLPGDVQAEILGIHQSSDEAEIIGQQVGALVHD